jgi:ubiquinone biosynthesis protein
VLLDVLIAAEDLGRLQEITRILVRFGFDDVARRMGLVGLLQRAGQLLNIETRSPEDAGSTARRARLALEELGPTFVKLGQVLASRRDLLPPEWIDELSRLQSRVATVPWEELRGQLEQDLGAPPEQVFEDLDTEPLAAGSIAQVHTASLPDGRPVVLKIRRPGVEKKVASDLRLLERLAETLEREVEELRRFRPTMVVRQFSRSIKAELDFTTEARNTRLIARNMEGFPELVIPEVFDEYTERGLLVLERIDGLPASDWPESPRREEFDGPALAALGARAILKMVFEDGVYHADPHPGNVLFLEGGRVAASGSGMGTRTGAEESSPGRAALLDFGMIGRLSEARREQFTLLLAAVVERDEEGLVDTLLEWSDGGDTDLEALVQDCQDFMDRYTGHELQDIDVASLLLDITRMVRENDLVLPADVAGLIKVFLSLEGLGRQLDPSFNLDAHVEPMARRMMLRMRSPRRMLVSNWREVRRLAVALPRDLRKAIQRMRRGGFKIELDLERLDTFGRQLDHAANRVTVGLITSSLIVGTSIAMTIDTGPTWFGIPVLGFLGFGTSFAVGVVLLWSILRSGIR